MGFHGNIYREKYTELDMGTLLTERLRFSFVGVPI